MEERCQQNNFSFWKKEHSWKHVNGGMEGDEYKIVTA